MLFDFRPTEQNSEFSNSGEEGCKSSIRGLEKLTDAELGESTLRAARDEKLATESLLEHLCEVERRFLFAAWGFSSLHEYVERGLGYLGSAANERVMAARFLKKVPAVKVALTSGTHTLTSVAMIGRHVKREELSLSEASELLQRCEEKSSREIERILVEGSTQVLPLPEKVRAVSLELTRLTLEVDSEFMALVHRMKELRRNPGGALAELFRAAMAEYTKKRAIKTKGKREPREKSGEKLASAPVDPSENQSELVQKLRAPVTRYIIAHVRNRVRKRATNRCEYIDPISGRRCVCRTRLQFDHYPVPFAMGGGSTAENLRYVCRTHNTFHAVQRYGALKMSAYRKK